MLECQLEFCFCKECSFEPVPASIFIPLSKVKTLVATEYWWQMPMDAKWLRLPVVVKKNALMHNNFLAGRYRMFRRRRTRWPNCVCGCSPINWEFCCVLCRGISPNDYLVRIFLEFAILHFSFDFIFSSKRYFRNVGSAFPISLTSYKSELSSSLLLFIRFDWGPSYLKIRKAVMCVQQFLAILLLCFLVNNCQIFIACAPSKLFLSSFFCLFSAVLVLLSKSYKNLMGFSRRVYLMNLFRSGEKICTGCFFLLV